VQQGDIFDAVQAGTKAPSPVIDARDVLENPARMLRLLCDAIGVPFREAMLAWPPGRRETDGVWAKHWYGEVETSTSFRPYEAREYEVPERLRSVYEACLEVYERLRMHRIH